MTCTLTAFERSPDAGRAWAEERRPRVVARVRNRLAQLSAHPGARTGWRRVSAPVIC